MNEDNELSDALPYSVILDNFEKLAERANRSKPEAHCKRIAVNNRVLTELRGKIYKQDPSAFFDNPSAVQISVPDLLMLKRGAILNLSGISYAIDFFRWCRVSAIGELATQAHQAANDNSLLVAIMALRSILEICGNAVLLERDLRALAEPKDELPLTLENWLNEVDGVIDARLAGTRLNYGVLTQSSLRDVKKMAYTPGEFEADRTAKDLLKGVDILDKRIKGSRAAYEFFSEFAHPNLASAWTHYDSTKILIRVLDIHGYEVLHRQRHVGAIFLETFGARVAEGIEIATECVDELLRISLILKANSEIVRIRAQKVIRGHIKRDPKSFDVREQCPCNQGKRILLCCGKLINSSKFGKHTAATF
jgi:hypothetical protein